MFWDLQACLSQPSRVFEVLGPPGLFKPTFVDPPQRRGARKGSSLGFRWKRECLRFMVSGRECVLYCKTAEKRTIMVGLGLGLGSV